MNHWNTGTEKEIVTLGAAFITASAWRAVDERGEFTLVLAGGNSPRKLYELLARGVDEGEFMRCGFKVPPHAERSKLDPSCIAMPWKSTWLFQGDERCVPPGHPESNYRMAWETLIRHIDIAEHHIFRMESEESDADTAALRYELRLKRFFDEREISGKSQFPQFDLVILGLGDDGHTASLFPGSSSLEERSQWVVSAKAPPRSPVSERISLSLTAINHASEIMFYVSGRKEELALQVQKGERADLPAGQVHPRSGKPFWLVVQS